MEENSLFFLLVYLQGLQLQNCTASEDCNLKNEPQSMQQGRVRVEEGVESLQVY